MSEGERLCACLVGDEGGDRDGGGSIGSEDEEPSPWRIGGSREDDTGLWWVEG